MIGPDVFARVAVELTAPAAPANVNELPADEQRALIKAEMARKRAAVSGGFRGR